MTTKPAEFLRRTGRASVATALVASLTLSACATSELRTEFIGNAVDDVCAPDREGLVRSEEHFNETLVKGALAGAAIGAIVGALSSEDAAKGAIFGAGIGGLSGLAAGYLKAKLDQAEDRDELRQSIYGDAAVDGTQLSELQQSITALNQCRARQIAKVREELSAGTIAGEEARQRAAAIRIAIGRDSDLVAEILGDANERNSVYRTSVARVDAIEEDTVRGRAKTYEPTIVNRSRTRTGLPEVSSRSRPQGENEIAASEIALKDTRALADAQSLALEQDLADLDVILS